MDENIDSPSKRGSFWKTAPGVLTALATLLTAIVGLIAGLNQLGIFERSSSSEAQPRRAEQISKNTSNTPQRPPTPAAGLSATADDITYTILSGHREPYSPSEYLLVLEMKISFKQNLTNVTGELFRLEVDGLRYAPRNGGSNHYGAPYSDWKEKYEFIVPNDAHVTNLLVGQFDSARTSTIPLPLDVISRWK